MKKNIMILCVIIVLLISVCYAGSFVDDTSTEFDLGMYNWTAWKISDVLLSGELPDYDVNSAVDTTGLVGLWHLNNKVEDSSGENHGQAMNGVNTIAGGKIGRAGNFDGVDDLVYIPNSDSLTSMTSITLETWIKANQTQPDPGVSTIIRKDSNTGSPRTIYNTYLNTGGEIAFQFMASSGGLTTGSGTTDLRDNVWHHVVVIRDIATDRVYGYIDGVKEIDVADSTTGSFISNPITPLYIGQWNLDGANRRFKGSIDEVSIYNRALAADEINQTYQRGLSALSNNITDGRVAFYKMDEPSWTEIQDTSGNNNHGTIYGAISSDGKLNTALSFDGTNDYVDCGNDASLDITDAITIETWVKPSVNTFYEPLITKGYYINSADCRYLNLYTSYADGKIWWRVRHDGNSKDISSDVITLDWHHVVATYSSGDMELFVDGISVGTATGADLISVPTYHLLIGNWKNTYYFNGKIDEVAIYNRSLSADEILAHYNAQKDNYPSSGDYKSKVFDAGSSVAWENISWAEDVPYGEELPDNGFVETVSGGANMTGNVLLMHMDEASGTIEDTSGNANHGTASGGVTYEASGKFDKALSFDGSTGYVERSYDPDFVPGTGSWTVEAWVKTSSGNSGKSIVDWYRCGADPSCSASDSASYLLGISSNNQSYWYVRDDYSTKVTLTSPLSVVDNSWHHLVGTYSPSPDSIKLYVDGVEVNSSSSVNFISLSSGGTSVPLEIGRHYIRSWGSPSSYFNGLIDEVAIFNRALSADEILDHYKRGALRLNISAKSCDDADCAGETTWDKACTSSPCDISTLSNSQYMQYKIDMQSDSSSTLEISSVSVFYGTAVNPFTVGGIELMYRTPVNVTEDSGISLTDYQVLLTVDTASLISEGKMQADCDDIRFTDSDETTELSYWLESDCNTANTKVWVKVPSLAASSTRIIYIYYGNSNIGSASNGDNTFEFFDDFEDRTLGDLNGQGGWYSTGTIVNVINSISYEGDKSAQTISSTSSMYISHNVTPLMSGIATFYSRGTGTERTLLGTFADTDTTYGYILNDHDYGRNGIIYNFNGVWDTTVRKVTNDGQWYKSSIYWNMTNWWFNVDDGANIITKTWSSQLTTGIDRLMMGHRVSQSAGQETYDLISVRKYASSEPTTTIGSEQQNVATPCTDNDGDGYGAEGTNLSQCNNSITLSDCNDSNTNIHPGATDIPNNGLDEDCSGTDNVISFGVYPVFAGESVESPATYYVGDDIGYQITFKVNGTASDEYLDNLKIELTDSGLNILKTQYLDDMTRQSAGVYTGLFTSEDLSAYPSNEGVRLTAYAYDVSSNLLNSGIHADQYFFDGTAPSFISTAYTYLTDALSNHTVKDLVINSTEAKIDWSESTLDLHARNIDLDSALTIGDRSAYLDSAAYSELNDSATITFYDVNCASAFVFYSETASTRAAILAENKQCLPPRCTDIQCSGSTLTVTVSSFTGYAAESDANLTIDADDPKFAGAEVHFTADYRNVTDDSLISGATCTIYFTDGNYAMAEGATYTYNRTFVTEGLKDYNVTCSKIGFSTLTAFDNATIVSVEIPEFSMITLGLGLIIILIGLFIIRGNK